LPRERGYKHNFKQGPEGQTEVEKKQERYESFREKQERLKKTLEGGIRGRTRGIKPPHR
jgi:hypothetical protein